MEFPSPKHHLPNPPKFIAPFEDRRKPEALAVLTPLSKLVRMIVGPSKIFETARKEIPGFSALYARQPNHHAAVAPFVAAFKADMQFWIDKGHSEFVGCKFMKRLPEAGGSTTTYEGEEEDEMTDESSEFDEKEYTKAKQQLSVLDGEIDAISASCDGTIAQIQDQIAKENIIYMAAANRINALQRDLCQVRSTYKETFAKATTKRAVAAGDFVKQEEKKRRCEARERLGEIEKKKKELEDEEAKLKEFLSPKK
jgi:hypothetical protein